MKKSTIINTLERDKEGRILFDTLQEEIDYTLDVLKQSINDLRSLK